MANLKYKVGDEILFQAYTELGPYPAEGTILGFGDLAKKFWPDECRAVGDNDAYVIKEIDRFGNRRMHLVYPEDIEAKKIGKEEK